MQTSLCKYMQAGIAGVLERLQAMAPVDEAMAHRATFIFSRISTPPQEEVLAI